MKSKQNEKFFLLIIKNIFPILIQLINIKNDTSKAKIERDRETERDGERERLRQFFGIFLELHFS